MTKGLTDLARDLRKRSTDIEQLLWSHLRAGRLEGLKFRRQHPIGRYIVDFVCLEKKLIIELDGGQHALPEEMEKDTQRDAWIEKEGYVVVRFWDNEVLTNLKGVLEVIMERLLWSPSPQSPPLKGGEGLRPGRKITETATLLTEKSDFKSSNAFQTTDERNRIPNPGAGTHGPSAGNRMD